MLAVILVFIRRSTCEPCQPAALKITSDFSRHHICIEHPVCNPADQNKTHNYARPRPLRDEQCNFVGRRLRGVYTIPATNYFPFSWSRHLTRSMTFHTSLRYLHRGKENRHIWQLCGNYTPIKQDKFCFAGAAQLFPTTNNGPVSCLASGHDAWHVSTRWVHALIWALFSLHPCWIMHRFVQL